MAEIKVIEPAPEFVAMFRELLEQQRMLLEIYQKLICPPMIYKSEVKDAQ